MTVDIAAIGTIIGALIGVISLLLRLLVASKNEQIRTLEETLVQVRAERDLYRDLTLTHRRD